jgi:hypothetical protein
METSGPTTETEQTIDSSTGSTETIVATQPEGTAPLDILTLDDILNEQVVKQQKEDADRQTLLSIATQSTQDLKPILVQWATRGFPAAYPIHHINIVPPSFCVDGVERSLYDYIVYLTGKPIQEHVSELSSKFQGMAIGFANMGNGTIAIVVSRA